MDTVTITIARYDELIKKAMRLDMLAEYLEDKTYVNKDEVRQIIGVKKEGDE